MLAKLSKLIPAALIMASMSFVLTSGFPLDGLRELSRIEEQHFKGAGVFTSMQCVSASTYNCVNGLVLGGTCTPGAGNGVECDVDRDPMQCLSKIGVYDECTATVSQTCPTGVIMWCPNGVWENKQVGDGQCGLWDDC